MNKQIKALARLTVQDPRAAAAGLLADKNAIGQAMPLALLVVILGVFISVMQSRLLPIKADTFTDSMVSNPLLLAIVQFMALMISCIGIFVIGRMFRGRGTFNETLLLSVWLQFFMLFVQVSLIFLTFISTPLAELLNIVFFFLFLWLTVNFVAELHGFRSLIRVLGGFIGASVGIAFVMVIVLKLVGVDLEGV